MGSNSSANTAHTGEDSLQLNEALRAADEGETPSTNGDAKKVDGTAAGDTQWPEDDHLNTDDRHIGDWDSRYPPRARMHICLDASYVASVLILTLVAILFTWRGTLFHWLGCEMPQCHRATFDRYAYFYLGGQLGGTLFGVKYLYNVVARWRWNIDRRLWRVFSPFLSAGLALAVGALIDAGALGLTLKARSGAAYLSLGFITGYFADSALRKMKEIANTIFGSPEHHSGQQGK